MLALDDGPERQRWRRLLDQSERALMDAAPPPRPGLCDADVARALAAAEQRA